MQRAERNRTGQFVRWTEILTAIYFHSALHLAVSMFCLHFSATINGNWSWVIMYSLNSKWQVGDILEYSWKQNDLSSHYSWQEKIVYSCWRRINVTRVVVNFFWLFHWTCKECVGKNLTLKVTFQIWLLFQRLMRIRSKLRNQARKPRSYASSKLRPLTYSQGWGVELLA